MQTITIHGEERKLGCLEPPRGHVFSLPVFADSVQTMSMSEIKEAASVPEADGRHLFGDPNLIADQGNAGSCNGWAGALSLARAEVHAGYEWCPLSGSYLYSLINGNRDNGSMLEDGMRAIQQQGCATEKTVPWNRIFRSQYDNRAADNEASHHLAFECYRLNTQLEFWTALAKRYNVIVAVHVGNNFSRLNSLGVAGFDSGYGNHAVGVDGLTLVNGQLVATAFNSWGTAWGVNGRMNLVWRHFEQTIDVHQFYAIRGVQSDVGNPPVPGKITVA